MSRKETFILTYSGEKTPQELGFTQTLPNLLEVLADNVVKIAPVMRYISMIIVIVSIEFDRVLSLISILYLSIFLQNPNLIQILTERTPIPISWLRHV